MGCTRIMDQNWLDQSALANDDVSSEQTAFPVLNAYNKNRRSKVWRSNGYFHIVSTNSDIVFRETIAGPDLVASIALAEYTSTAAFMTAVKAALELVGASTYTITQNANKKFVISSNGVGGDGSFTIYWTDPLSTAAGVLGFNETSDDSGALSYTADFLRIHTEEWILWDMGISSNPTHFIFIGPRNSPVKLSPNAVIKLQGNETNDWTVPSFEMDISYDDEVLYLENEDGLHTSALRYWRVYFEDQNPLGYIEVGAFFLGTHLEFERGAPQFPFQEGEIDRTETVFSEGGQTYSEIKPKTQSHSLQWLAITKLDQQMMREHFFEVGTGVPFFVMFDSVAGFSSEVNRRIKYVKFSAEPVYQLVSPNNYSAQWNLEEQI